VIGSGAAGLTAAVAAAARGAAVTLLEAAAEIGGTTAFCGGGIWIPDNPYAASVGTRDSRDDALRYLDALGLGDIDRELCRAYVENGMRVVRATANRGDGLRMGMAAGAALGNPRPRPARRRPRLDRRPARGRQCRCEPVRRRLSGRRIDGWTGARLRLGCRRERCSVSPLPTPAPLQSSNEMRYHRTVAASREGASVRGGQWTAATDGHIAERQTQGPAVPAGRLGQPAGIAATVSFLVLHEAGSIVGQMISANGGIVTS
jgi:hypothetical protein